MKRRLLFLLTLLALCSGVSAEDGGSPSNIRKIGPEESKALFKSMGLVLREHPPYPDVAYRLYEAPYMVSEIGLIFGNPFEFEGELDEPSEDEKIWGIDGEPVVLLNHPRIGDFIEGFFSQKRLPIERVPHDGWYYKIGKENNRQDKGENRIDSLRFYSNRIKTTSESYALFSFLRANMQWRLRMPRALLAPPENAEDLPFPLGDARGALSSCEPLVSFVRRINEDGSVRWSKTVARYYPPRSKPAQRTKYKECKTPYWLNDGYGEAIGIEQENLLVTASPRNFVIRLRWDDGEPTGPLPPFLKVLDEREVLTAKWDLLKRYKAELDRRGLTNDEVSKLHTPEGIMHDLAAYFFDIQAIRNWNKGGGK